MYKRFLLFWHTDPRHYQLAILSCLLLYGVIWLNFEVQIRQVIVILSTALLIQFIGTRLFHLAYFDPKSTFISSLSLCILLRSNSLWAVGLAALITVLSKFIFRWHDKHLFNPTNFGIVTTLFLTGQVWVSPGQWGNTAFFSFLIACLGMLVTHRSTRSDVTIAFLGFYITLLFGRALWLGDPLSIPLHQLHNGALLLFAFFMISDPKTTPNSRSGRILFAFLVAIGAAFVQFVLYRTNGLLWSLVFFSLLVPLIDQLLPGKYYTWETNQMTEMER